MQQVVSDVYCKRSEASIPAAASAAPVLCTWPALVMQCWHPGAADIKQDVSHCPSQRPLTLWLDAQSSHITNHDAGRGVAHDLTFPTETSDLQFKSVTSDCSLHLVT